MASYLNEENIEGIALRCLDEVGYKVYKSASYTSPNAEIDAERNNDHTQPILKGQLENALRKLNPGFNDEVYRNAIHQFEMLADSPDMMLNNHKLHELIIGGAKVKTSIKGEDRTITLYPIDFKNVDNNTFVATNQFTMKQGEHERRPDITLFINGLPLVTFELKNPANANVGIQQAFAQFSTLLKRAFATS